MTESLTVDVLLHPGEGDAALLAALTEAEQEGAWGLWAQDGPSLSLLMKPMMYLHEWNTPRVWSRDARESNA